MSEGVKTVLFPVRDVEAAKAVFNALLDGLEPIADAAYYVGWNIEGQDIGLVPNGHKAGMTGATVYFVVDDINATMKAMLDAGAQANEDVRDVGGGKLVATIKDPDGNVIGITQNP
ncbi:MAG TPA: VOC family protein [Candidatus Limnocylindrales bacterium]|nr:VOC family protein [Candidatus Limnocylindrales bacterium]